MRIVRIFGTVLCIVAMSVHAAAVIFCGYHMVVTDTLEYAFNWGVAMMTEMAAFCMCGMCLPTDFLWGRDQ